jgi:hypothetical protein
MVPKRMLELKRWNISHVAIAQGLIPDQENILANTKTRALVGWNTKSTDEIFITIRRRQKIERLD